MNTDNGEAEDLGLGAGSFEHPDHERLRVVATPLNELSRGLNEKVETPAKIITK